MNETYERLIFEIDGVVMRYSATDIKIENDFIKFTDKYANTYEFRMSLLIGRACMRADWNERVARG